MSRKSAAVVDAVGAPIVAAIIFTLVLLPVGCERKKDAGGAGGTGAQMQYSEQQEKVLRIACMTQLHQLGRGLMMYAAWNADWLPRSLEQLKTGVMVTGPEVFQCPKLRKLGLKEHYTYLADYLGEAYLRKGQGSTTAPATQSAGDREAAVAEQARKLVVNLRFSGMPRPAETPLVWDYEPTHTADLLVNVVFADGHVESVSAEKLRAMLKEALESLPNAVRPAGSP